MVDLMYVNLAIHTYTIRDELCLESIVLTLSSHNSSYRS